MSYAKNNAIINIKKFVNEITQDAEQIQDFLEDLNQQREPYKFYFESLQDSERKTLLSLQKGKINKNRLRYYAIKIDDDCFVITGGAIKMSQKMQDHIDTTNELTKLKEARAYLRQNGVFDEDSFFELLIEQQ